MPAGRCLVAQHRRRRDQPIDRTALAERRTQRIQLVQQHARMRGEVERQHRIGQQPPQRVHIDARVAHQVLLVDLVQQIVRRVPPPAERVAHLHRRRRLLAERAEHRGNADAPERLIGGTRHALAGILRARLLADRIAGQRDQFRRGGSILQHRRADAAGGIDVHMHRAAPFQLVPVLIGIPGGTGIAAMRMAGPEAKPQPAPPLAALARGEPRHLQHRGVGRAVVHHAVVPGVVMAGEQDERTVRVGCRRSRPPGSASAASRYRPRHAASPSAARRAPGVRATRCHRRSTRCTPRWWAVRTASRRTGCPRPARRTSRADARAG